MSERRGAFDEQLVVLLPQLRAVARLLTRDVQSADDLVQDTVVRALAARDQWRDGTDLRAWCLTILRRRYYEHWRRDRRDPTRSATPAPEPAVAPAQEDNEALRQLATSLSRLTPILREALVLVGAQGLSYEEAAAICEVPVGTMKARVSRARRELAAGLDPGEAPRHRTGVTEA